MPRVRWLHAGSPPDGKALRGAELRPLRLLNLTPGIPLEGRGAEVRAHNAAFTERLAGSSPPGGEGSGHRGVELVLRRRTAFPDTSARAA